MIEIVLPVTKKDVEIFDIKYSQYKKLQRYFLLDDHKRISKLLIDIIYDCSDYGHNKNDNFFVREDRIHTIERLNNIDKLYILLNIKQYSIESSIKLEAGENRYEEVPIYKIIEALESVEFKIEDVEVNEDLKVVIGPPSDLFIESNSDLFFGGCINGLIHRGHDFTRNFLSKDIENRVPASVSGNIKEIIDENEELAQQVTLVQYKNGNKEPIKLSLFNNFVYHFICQIFKTDLSYLYDVEYLLSSKVNIRHEYMMDMSPVEMEIFVAKRSKEIAEQNKANQDNAAPQQGGFNLPPM